MIEEHLNEELNIDTLTKAAALSPYYYQRLFSHLVKVPVKEYIKLRRLAKSTELLLQENQRILDVAMTLGFSSHQHFTRSFKETFKMTPKEYQKNPQVMNRMTKPELLLQYTLIDEGVPLITDGIVLEVNIKQLTESILYVGLEQKMPVTFIEGMGTCSGVNPLDTLWRNFHRSKVTKLVLQEDFDDIGVTYSYAEPGYFCYFAGGRRSMTDLPVGYTS